MYFMPPILSGVQFSLNSLRGEIITDEQQAVVFYLTKDFICGITKSQNKWGAGYFRLRWRESKRRTLEPDPDNAGGGNG
jgi:hypothetical protein